MSSSTKTWLCEQSSRGYSPRSRARARTSARRSITWRPTGLLGLPAPRASAVDRRVAAALPKTKASKRSTSRLGLNPSSPEAKEEVPNAVACQESTRTEDFTLKAKKTEAEPARRCAVLEQGALSSVSRAFVRTTRREETKKGAAFWKSLPSRKTRRAPHHHRR